MIFAFAKMSRRLDGGNSEIAVLWFKSGKSKMREKIVCKTSWSIDVEYYALLSFSLKRCLFSFVHWHFYLHQRHISTCSCSRARRKTILTRLFEKYLVTWDALIVDQMFADKIRRRPDKLGISQTKLTIDRFKNICREKSISVRRHASIIICFTVHAVNRCSRYT